MNKRLVAYMQGAVLLIEAACMTPALVIALFQQDGDAWALGATMLILIAIGAAPGRDESNVRRSALPRVIPNPFSSGSTVNLAKLPLSASSQVIFGFSISIISKSLLLS